MRHHQQCWWWSPPFEPQMLFRGSQYESHTEADSLSNRACEHAIHLWPLLPGQALFAMSLEVALMPVRSISGLSEPVLPRQASFSSSALCRRYRVIEAAIAQTETKNRKNYSNNSIICLNSIPKSTLKFQAGLECYFQPHLAVVTDRLQTKADRQSLVPLKRVVLSRPIRGLVSNGHTVAYAQPL